MALRYYFDLVCPYSYILAHEVEGAEDEGLGEVEWLPFELRPAPAALPEPRGEYIRDHWRDHVYGLAQNHGVEIHVPTYQPAPRSPWRSTPSPKNEEAAERTARRRTTPSSSRPAAFATSRNTFSWPRSRPATKKAAAEAAWDLDRISALRSVREEALGIGVHRVPTIATKEEVLYYGAASPGKIHALLANR